MLDFIMNLLGFENVRNIKIPQEYKIPRTEKLNAKWRFYQDTKKFMDKVIINNEKMLLDGYTTIILCKWKDKKYIRVARINMSNEEYLNKYKSYDQKRKTNRKEEKNDL